MGRPYSNELSALPETYRWALEVDIGRLVEAVRAAADLPLAAVGSGGSLSAAQFCADWHQHATGRLSRAMTPLEVVGTHFGFGSASAAIFSAGGRNSDIRRAFSRILETEPEVCWIMTGASRSPLADEARAASIAPLIVAERPPAGRDGFLATNSLLGFAVLTHRAYAAAFPGDEPASLELPLDWSAFAGDSPTLNGASAKQLWSASTLVVLHGITTRAAATDLESKCTEAGLINTQLADFRNFAHGRHHWLAKHPTSAVLAIVTPEDAALADRTLALIPRSIPTARLEIAQRGFRGGLRGLADVIRLVEDIGRARDIDPGRPGVPSFGGKLYSLRGLELLESIGTRAPLPRARSIARSESKARLSARIAIEKKLDRPFDGLSRGEQFEWREAYAAARNHLVQQEYVAAVLDYDGTLVDAADRFSGPRQTVMDALIRLLAGGVVLGIATGRGRSAGNELRARLPAELWSQVTMGYYNASDVRSLTVIDGPDRSTVVDSSLKSVLHALQSSPSIARLAKLTPRRCQITLEPNDVSRSQELWAAAEGVVLRAGQAVRLVRSSHSIDLLAPGTTKMSLVATVIALAGRGSDAPVLRIGDRGRWPGNDAELLSVRDGISVDEVAADPESAWNFAPPGVRGAAATQLLLGQSEVKLGLLRLNWNDSEEGEQALRRPSSRSDQHASRILSSDPRPEQ